MANERVSKALGEKFAFSITNTSGATVVIALLAAIFNTLQLVEGAPNVVSFTNPTDIIAAGYPCDAVLDDGTIAVGVVCTAMNAKKSIRQFREFVKNNPRVCVDMTVQATIPAQFNQTMEVIKYNPFIGALAQELSFNEFKSIDQQATDKININGIGLEMAFDTLCLLPVPTGCTTTITLKFS